MPPIFPPEIFRIIIIDLSNQPPDRNVLLPLLLVSKAFFEIGTSLLYESICAVKPPYRAPPSPPSTRILPNNLSPLYRSPIHNPRLSEHTKTLILCMGYYYGDDKWKVIEELICSLPRLRCLSIPHQPPPIPQTVSLTHLVIRSDCTEETYNLILLQPNLRYLRLGRISSETVLEHLPNVRLPQLNFLDSSVHFLNKLDGSPPIEDLTLSITPNDRRGNVQIIPIHIIRRIRSLKCSLHVLEKLVSYCDGLEYLWTIRTHTFKPILSISSSALRYICLEYRHLNFSYDPSIFDRFPALAIIDFGGAMSDYPRVRRLIRGALVISWMTEGEVNGPPFHQDGFPVWRGLAEGVIEELKLTISEM